jgi:uncharacterized membrane protein
VNKRGAEIVIAVIAGCFPVTVIVAIMSVIAIVLMVMLMLIAQEKRGQKIYA